MGLPAFNIWEIALDGAQIFLCSAILLYLIRNKMKHKQLVLKAPNEENSQNFNAEFIIQAVRQQSELAFTHILETIDKERQTLDTYFEQRESQIASNLLKTAQVPAMGHVATAESVEAGFTDTIYNEIKSMADQGITLEDISEKLNVPKGEVELVLKLKRLSVESDKNKTNPQ